MRKPEHVEHVWQIGPGRGCAWKHGLPLPGHRSMAQVMASERLAALERGALAFGRVKRAEPANDPGDETSSQR